MVTHIIYFETYDFSVPARDRRSVLIRATAAPEHDDIERAVRLWTADGPGRRCGPATIGGLGSFLDSRFCYADGVRAGEISTVTADVYDRDQRIFASLPRTLETC